MSKTIVAANKVLDHMLGTTQWAFPTSVTCHLATAAADAEGGVFTEVVAGNGYAPVEVKGKFAAAADGSVANNATVQFGEATAAKGHPTHFFLKNNAGEIIRYGVLPGGGFDYVQGLSPRFPVGALTCSEE